MPYRFHHLNKAHVKYIEESWWTYFISVMFCLTKDVAWLYFKVPMSTFLSTVYFLIISCLVTISLTIFHLRLSATVSPTYFSWLNQTPHIWFILCRITVSNDATSAQPTCKRVLIIPDWDFRVWWACSHKGRLAAFNRRVGGRGWMPLKVLQTPPTEGGGGGVLGNISVLMLCWELKA